MALFNCRDVVDSLLDYLAQSLDPMRRSELEAHLAACDRCVAYLRSYEGTVRLGRAAFEDVDEAAGTDVAARLVEAILAARRRTS